MKNQNQPIAREGYPFIFLLGFVTLVFAVLGWGFLTLVLLALTLFTAFFFRNPERRIPGDEKAVVSPADGKIVFAGVVNEERYLEAEVNKVSIFMSAFDVHVNRVPLAGKVVDLHYHKGKFLNASLDKASDLNERSGMIMETANGAWSFRSRALSPGALLPIRKSVISLRKGCATALSASARGPISTFPKSGKSMSGSATR